MPIEMESLGLFNLEFLITTEPYKLVGTALTKSARITLHDTYNVATLTYVADRSVSLCSTPFGVAVPFGRLCSI